MRGKEPHLGRRALGSASAHTWPDKACHMYVLAGKCYCLVFMLPATETVRMKWGKKKTTLQFQESSVSNVLKSFLLPDSIYRKPRNKREEKKILGF